MVQSRLIACFAGPLFMALGSALLINRGSFAVLATDIARDRGLIFLSGILALLAGIAIVRVHNTWARGWPVIITVLGWLAILGGLARMWFFDSAAAIAAWFGSSPSLLLIAGLSMLALGGFLSFKAFSSNT